MLYPTMVRALFGIFSHNKDKDSAQYLKWNMLYD